MIAERQENEREKNPSCPVQKTCAAHYDLCESSVETS